MCLGASAEEFRGATPAYSDSSFLSCGSGKKSSWHQEKENGRWVRQDSDSASAFHTDGSYDSIADSAERNACDCSESTTSSTTGTVSSSGLHQVGTESGTAYVREMRQLLNERRSKQAKVLDLLKKVRKSSDASPLSSSSCSTTPRGEGTSDAKLASLISQHPRSTWALHTLRLEKCAAVVEREQARAQYAALMREHVELQQKHEALLAEFRALQREHQEVETECETLRLDVEVLRQQRIADVLTKEQHNMQPPQEAEVSEDAAFAATAFMTRPFSLFYGHGHIIGRQQHGCS